MDMVLICLHGEQGDPMLEASGSYYIFEALLNLSCEDGLSILGYPHEMVGNTVVCPSCFTILYAIRHSDIL